MKIFAISDLHLSFMVEKPMDIFGGHWENYTEKIKDNWQKTISDDDLVLICGDISWAMKMSETVKDFEYIDSLHGKKIIIRGNHDYWWKSISAIRETLPASISALQNDSMKVGNVVIAGTRGWEVCEGNMDFNFSQQDKKIFNREVIRLRLALEDAMKRKEKEDKLICMIHYPPFNSHRDDSGFTKLFEEFKVDAVIYGHIHNNIGRYERLIVKNGIPYYLTSADMLHMKPAEIVL